MFCFVFSLQKRGYRVIVLNTYPPAAKRFLCQAYRLQKMHYPQYVWLLPGWFDQNWWKETEDHDTDNNSIPGDSGCTNEELKTMLMGTLGIMEASSDYLGKSVCESVSFI